VILPLLAADDVPRIVIPAPNQVSFGRVVARLPRGTHRVVLLVDGKAVARRSSIGRRRITVRYQLPRRDATLRILAIDSAGARTRSSPVGPVFGLPAPAAPKPAPSRRHNALARALKRHLSSFSGTSGFYVRDLATGAGASWNATARFPAGSTLKLALALEALRVSDGAPPANSQLRRRLESMILDSSNIDTNELAVSIAGSTSAASARVNVLMSRIGMTDSDLFGGYLVDDLERATRGLATAVGIPHERPRLPPAIPLQTIDQPQLERGKHTTAADIARLFSAIHLAAGGRGPLVKHYRGEITPAEARYLLFLLTHTRDRGAKLEGLIPGASVAHKAGWISTARHDAGIVYWKGGAFVASVMTWNANGVGAASDTLAAKIARTTLTTFRG